MHTLIFGFLKFNIIFVRADHVIMCSCSSLIPIGLTNHIYLCITLLGRFVLIN